MVKMVRKRYDIGMVRGLNREAAIAELLAHVGRRAVSGGRVEGLTPVQWSALRYFGCANRFSQTPSAFAAFQATTRGTASQTVKSLVQAGYLERRSDAEDGRRVCFEPSAAGARLLESDPMAATVGAVADLAPGERDALDRCLVKLVAAMAAADGGHPFGTCRSCRYLAPDTRAQACAYYCQHEAAPLAEHELDGLCVRFDPADE